MKTPLPTPMVPICPLSTVNCAPMGAPANVALKVCVGT